MWKYLGGPFGKSLLGIQGMTLEFRDQKILSPGLRSRPYFPKKAGGETVPETKPAIAAKDTENQKTWKMRFPFWGGSRAIFWWRLRAQACPWYTYPFIFFNIIQGTIGCTLHYTGLI